ncbi:MAG: hypothetical protein KDB90_01995 [Planctomycetes bacterium]|nr:hypothetical protein [Planctomycetota bacterium]
MNPDRLFVVRWTAAIAAALLLDNLLSGEVAEFGMFWPPVRAALVFGLLGLLQGLALRGKARPAGFTFVTMMAGIVAVQTSMFTPPVDLAGWSELPPVIHSGFAIGLLMGIFQIAALHGRMRRPVAWPIAMTLGWGAGYAILGVGMAVAVDGTDEASLRVGAIGGATVATMVIGGITGVAALKLIRKEDDDEQSRRVDETGEEHRG